MTREQRRARRECMQPKRKTNRGVKLVKTRRHPEMEEQK